MPNFDQRLKLQFQGAKLSSDDELLPFREVDSALDLTHMASWELRDNRTGKNRMLGKTRPTCQHHRIIQSCLGDVG